MCWNLEVSLLTGVFSWVVAGYLIKRNIRWDRTSALFLMAVSSMQFADAMLWWDGMEFGPDGSCTKSNWITSVIAIPLILRAQLILRQMEAHWAGMVPAITILIGLIIVFAMVVGGDGPLSPGEALHYFRTRECSMPSPIEHNSPLWGGLNMPFFCFIIYMSFAVPPMYMTGRYLECAFFVIILSSAFTFQDTWASKFCSIACSLALWYLFWSGPALRPQVEKMKTGQSSSPEKTGILKKLMQAHSKFCFGTAKLE